MSAPRSKKYDVPDECPACGKAVPDLDMPNCVHCNYPFEWASNLHALDGDGPEARFARLEQHADYTALMKRALASVPPKTPGSPQLAIGAILASVGLIVGLVTGRWLTGGSVLALGATVAFTAVRRSRAATSLPLERRLALVEEVGDGGWRLHLKGGEQRTLRPAPNEPITARDGDGGLAYYAGETLYAFKRIDA